MCDPVSAMMAVATVASTAQGMSSQSQAKKAAKQQQANAEKMYKAQDQDMNRRNAKQPNVAALMTANQDAIGGTSLTGPQGIDPGALYLGKNTALGA